MVREPAMLDFHTHTTASDGGLGIAELMRRAQVKGIHVIGIADHADFSTTARIVQENLQAVLRERELATGITPFCGIELTHVRPAHIGHLVESARQSGAEFVIVHGETISEPVEPGTNRAGIEAGCEILAHPGIISESEARRAAERGVLLEISSKPGHSLANGHVAAVARAVGAKVVYGSDTHLPEQLHNYDDAQRVLRAAGLSEQEAEQAFENARELFRRLFRKYVEEARDG